MIEKKRDLDRLTEQERVLGGLLAQGIPQGPTMTDCPSGEQLAEFIDGKLPHRSKEEVIAHLADCETCYAVVSDSLTVREEIIGRSRARIRRSLAYTVPSALAAAAVVLLVFRLWQPAQELTVKPVQELVNRQKSVPEGQQMNRVTASAPRSFAGDLASRLMRTAANGAPSRTDGKAPQPRITFGFSSAVPPDKAAFRIGMCLISLEVARLAKDRERIDAVARRLQELLKPLESSYGPIPTAGGPGGGKDGSGPDPYEGFSASLEALFNGRHDAVYLRFGAWVEAAGLAADLNDGAFFLSTEVRAFRDELAQRNEPVGTLKDLSRLETIISSGRIEPDQFKTITRLLADIREMY